MNHLSVVNFVSSSLCLLVLVYNGIDYVSSVVLIVARRDTPTLWIVTDQAVQSASRLSNLQVTAAQGCTAPIEGLAVGRLHGERSEAVGIA